VSLIPSATSFYDRIAERIFTPNFSVHFSSVATWYDNLICQHNLLSHIPSEIYHGIFPR